MSARALSIALAHGSGLIATLSFVFFLPEADFVAVTAAVSLAGMISGTVVSNNTAKIYVGMNAGYGMRNLVNVTLRLLYFEQLAALVFSGAFILLGGRWLDTLSAVEVLLLGLGSSFGALIAFTKFDDRAFVRFNLVRSVSTLLRLALVHWAARAGLSGAIPAIIIITFVFPFLYGVIIIVSARRASKPCPVDIGLSVPIVLREYLFGLPVAVSRAFFNHGVLVIATQTLSGDALRMFRFLLLPKDMFGRTFNAVLPLVFDRLYEYRPRLMPGLGIVFLATIVALGWYLTGMLALGFDGSAAATYTIYLTLNLAVYSVFPVVWRTIHRNKAIHQMTVVLTATGTALLTVWLLPPISIEAILITLSVYTGTYLAGTLLLGRLEVAGRGR
jgi:hypothetical protein